MSTDPELTAALRELADNSPPDDEAVRRFREGLRRLRNDPAERERIERIADGLDEEDRP